jgi:diguanylate cyclase (GGDEF)-like protein/PAS domain S-box-containing protein
MSNLAIATSFLVLCGCAIMYAAILRGRRIRSLVPPELHRRWRIMVTLMLFFLVGYLCMLFVLVKRLTIPIELITGPVFMGGAVFVFIVTNLSGETIARIRAAEEALRTTNESLEGRVLDRTRDLRHAHEFLRTVLDSLNDDVLIIDTLTYKIQDANESFLMRYGLTLAEVIGKTCHEVTHHRSDVCSPPLDSCPLLETIATAEFATAEHMHRDKNGKTIYQEVTTSPIREPDGSIRRIVHVSRDITKRKLAEEQIHTLAYYDVLTGLPNRVLFKELLKRTFEYSRRHNLIFAILFIDLDDFKRINDTLGQGVGDQLLQVIANDLVKTLRSSDYVARSTEGKIKNVVSRQGGDEFIVLLQNLAQSKNAGNAAGRILQEFSKPYELSGQEVFMTASIGISLYPGDGENVENLLKNADTAMYQAKNKGKNNYQFYSREMNVAALELLTLENELHRALERNELQVYYQPKVAFSTRNIIGTEALIRWRHPDRGLISPAQFIPLAESGGLIVPIGEFVLRTACLQNKKWQEDGIKPMSVAVNLSSRQFDQKGLIKIVYNALKDAHLSPQYLELEITESTVMKNPEEAIEIMRELKAMGIRIAIDDFGTGYSSLNSLKQLPVDFLKIDNSFVRNLSSSLSDAAIVRTIIAMAHGLNLQVIAEGVETEQQLAFLEEHGCDFMQGFLFCHPLAVEEVSGILAKGIY